MNPTPRFRWLDRKKMVNSSQVTIPDGLPIMAFEKERVLQQWFAFDINYPMTRGEWKDVPVETEK